MQPCESTSKHFRKHRMKHRKKHGHSLPISTSPMFDVTSRGAQNAVESISDLLSVSSDLQVPMFPNNNARKASAKKTPEKKVDLGPKLARRKSQDFASKIQGWNQAGGGVYQKQDEVVVIASSETESEASKEAPKDAVQIVVETESTIAEEVVEVAKVMEITPTTPKRLGSPEDDAPKTSGAKKGRQEVDLNRGAWVRRKSKPQTQTETVEVKHAGTPKKRVVSDGHWRRDRQLKEETPAKEKELTPKPIMIRRSVVNVGLKIPASHQDFSETTSEAEPVRVRPLKPARSRSPSRSTEGRDVTPDYETSGTKVYIKRRRRSRQMNEDSKDFRKSETSLTAPSSVSKPSSATDTTTFSETLPKPKPTLRRPVSESRVNPNQQRSREDVPRPKSARRSLEAEDAPKLAGGSRRRTKTSLEANDRYLSPQNSAEAYARKITAPLKRTSGPLTAPVALKVHGNRIEGWLSNMQDPFVESNRSSLTPEPLTIAKKKPKAPIDSVDPEDFGSCRRTSDRKQISPLDSDGHKIVSKQQRLISEESLNLSPSTPTALRRTGARRKSSSPVKSRELIQIDEPVMSGALPNTSKYNSGVSAAAKQSAKPRIPGGGRPLSTILSVDTLQKSHLGSRKGRSSSRSDDTFTVRDESVLSRASDGDSPRRKKSGLRRRGTKHSDLMSVLSVDDVHTIVSARSIRTSQRKLEAATIGDVMNDLSTDELKYQRELRTLVNGVIPVLLQHALSEHSSAQGSRIFSRPTTDTKPIVDMGVALERLKTIHKRIPMHEPAELLTWADGASRVYIDYLRTWRLGFKNIVVNLAPAESSSEKPTWDDGLPRNKYGDLLDGAGERVDVAYLLKRPLVRLKYLTKTFKSITQMQPSANADKIAGRYQDLIAEAKKRVNDEQARLEDEAAANIDATRARDPRSLAPITGVSIDATRSVRARDYFDMDLVHSSGQQLGCKIEVVYRDDAPARGKSGDLLFCEISTTGRWLLWPPLPASLVSARKGDRPGELVLMIRGFLSNARQWREILSLKAEDERTSTDWMQMLSSSPMPPRLLRRSSFNMFKEARVPAPDQKEPRPTSADFPEKGQDPSPREIQVPFGEQAKSTSRVWDGSDVNSVLEDDVGPAESRGNKPARYRNTVSSPSTPGELYPSNRSNAAQPAYFYDQPRHDMHGERTSRRPVSSHATLKSDWTASSLTSAPSYSVWLPSEDRWSDESGDDGDRPERRPSTRPGMQRRTSSVPSMDMPTIPKQRSSAQPNRPDSPSSDRDQLPSQKRVAARQAKEPSSAPATLQKRRMSMFEPRTDDVESSSTKRPLPTLPAPSKQRPLSLGLNSGIIPSLTPAFLKKGRRPSSPLKREYEPSSASDSLSDSEFSDSNDDVRTQTSESTIDDDIEGVSTVGDLKGFQEYNMRELRELRQSPPPSSQPTLPGGSLAPSESASQSPYRTVPPTSMAPAKTVACIFSWADRGVWESLHPEECQIFVSPGLIEAFDLAQANAVPLEAEGEGSTPSSRGVKPLVALELTPLVPLRRGTAVDISIRSPPTVNSLIRMGNNVMFRSRSPEECERLYALINRARIDNPTFIALQHARGPVGQSNWAEAMDRRNAARTNPGTSRSWWNLGSRKSGSYRSKGSRTASVAATDSSVGTMNSAFSALRRFSGPSRIFNIAKSTIASKEGTRSTNSESLSSGVATPVPIDLRLGTPLGISNLKIRLYVRESASKWKDLGSARLNILLPPRKDPTVAPSSKVTGMEKRIMVYGKSRGEVMLDVTLGESAFERVARTGIAMSVYEESDQVAAIGGVLVAKTTVYMIQMKSERDAAYTFSLVGKLRY